MSQTEKTAEQDRKAWMGLLARSVPEVLADHLKALGASAEAEMLRAPEIGGVMVRGRAGGTGAPFNLGEMTVTRCSLRLPSGEVGHAYVSGRDKTKARNAALVDAWMQTDRADEVRRMVLEPLQAAETARRASRTQKAAATKVDFFTLARGED